MPALSVIIPTYQRAAILERCLAQLELQTISHMIEVIVISDGPDEPTRRLFAERQWSVPVSFFEIQKSHQGKARNKGLEHAKSPLVLFIGDDILLQPHACEEHLNGHKTPDTAVLGFTTWDPSLKPTPVMRWLEQSGWQFGYQLIGEYAHEFLPRDVQHQFSYTSNISLPLAIARSLPFREDVTLYGWEDVEWGMRLRQANVRVLYAPGAKAHHYHPVTLPESLQRMETLGESAKRLQAMVPTFDRVPAGLKMFRYHLAALLPTMAGRHRKAFLKGLKKAR
jgi:GT2 family glycosyltransferase